MKTAALLLRFCTLSAALALAVTDAFAQAAPPPPQSITITAVTAAEFQSKAQPCAVNLPPFRVSLSKTPRSTDSTAASPC